VAARKERTLVVLDTNVIAGHYLSRSAGSWNSQIIRLWRDVRKLQLVVSDELVEEYLGILRRLNIQEERVRRFENRLHARRTVTWVNLGPRFEDSRDPDDNLLLAVAKVGKAKFLVTNDRDLLEIPEEQRRRYRFQIATPEVFLTQLAE
jgi:putative PIN family toxin of toxin-antitoxin system